MAENQSVSFTGQGENHLPTLKNLKVCTFNCRGLRGKRKRLALFRTFKNEKFDIISIQETHIKEISEIKEIETEWGGTVHFSLGSSRSKGIITLFNTNIQDKFSELKEEVKTDRMVMSSMKYNSEILLIINVYSPCIDHAKIMFFNDVNTKLGFYLNKYKSSNLICLGDFNVTLSDKDIISGEPHKKAVRDKANELLLNYDLVDTWRFMNGSTKEHSWSKSNPPTARRLDYILVSEELGNYLKSSEIKGIGLSDHRMVTSFFEFSEFKRGPGLFKLNTSLLYDLNYCKIINAEIEKTAKEYENLNPHLRWEMIKTNIRECSQIYGRQISREKQNKNSKLFSSLNNLEKALSKNPNDSFLISSISRTKTELELSELEKAKGAQIRSATKFREEGEKCTRYFLTLEKINSNLNTITRLRQEDDTFITKENEILNKIHDKYKSLYNKTQNNDEHIWENVLQFTDNLNLPVLTEEEQVMCDEPISEQEVSAAVSSLNMGSSPGKDGLPAEFYKVFWPQLKKYFIECIEHSLSSESLPNSQNLAVITLLHKGKQTDSLDNWRPISLINVDYKILAKVLSKRLESVISKLIGPQQVGFMKGRHISDIHRIIDDILSMKKQGNSQNILLTIDFKQAFDSINMDYILKCLDVFGFGPVFKKWASLICRDRLTVVKNGGYLSKSFRMTNGVRQGCPISPQFFILGVEILAQKIIQDNKIKGIIPFKTSKPLKVCQYADDTSLFLQDMCDMKQVFSHLNSFSKFSGLTLNINKSYAMSMNGSHFDTESTKVKFQNRIKILGIIFSNTSCASEIEENWTLRIENIKRILSRWSRRDISIIGKIHIVKTFGLSQLVFLMKSIILPDSVLNQVNSLFFKFIWGKKQNKNPVEKVKRKVICNYKKKWEALIWLTFLPCKNHIY